MGNTKISKDCLGYLGDKVQKQIVKTMIEDNKYLSIYLNTIKKEKKFFTVKYLDDIIQIVKSRFDDRGNTPSYNEIYIAMKALYSTEEEYKEIIALLKELKGDELYKDIEEGEITGIDALRKAQALYTLNKCTKKIYDSKDIIPALNEAANEIIEISNPVSDNVVEGFAADFTDSIINSTPDMKILTGIEELDEQLNGGIQKKKVGLLIAGSGVGKTTLSSMICIGAALNDAKVMHIVFEDDPEDIYKMYLSRLTGKYNNEFTGEGVKEIIKTIYEKNPITEKALKENLHISHLSNGDTTVEMIKEKIKRFRNEKGWMPDMIFIDYLSCLLPTENKLTNIQNEWQVWEKCMKKLEVLAKEMNIAVWVSQQTNRDGMKLSTANDRMANIQGSYRAVQPASYVLYLDKTGCEMNRANLYLDKCRGCQKKEWKNIYFNNGTCQIDLSEVETDDENLIYNEND